MQLTELILICNTCSECLDRTIVTLQQLKTLGICQCNHPSVQERLGGLEELKELDLRFYHCSEFLYRTNCQLKRLTKLFILKCNLTSVPHLQIRLDYCSYQKELNDLVRICNTCSECLDRTIDKFQRVKTLGICQCNHPSVQERLGGLEESFWYLMRLKELVLICNTCSECLDRTIDTLQQLKTLGICHCNHPSVQERLGGLEELEELDLSWNNCSECLDLTIDQLQRLKTLGICKCNLPSVQEFLGGLEELKELDLIFHNCSECLDRTHCHLKRLKKLNLRGCDIRSVPEWFGRLEELEVLDLSDNNFTEGLALPICQLQRLKKLNLSECNLWSVPEWLGRLEELEELDLSRNNFSEDLIGTIVQLQHIKKLNLNGCDIRSFPELLGRLQALEELDLSENNFSALRNGTLGQLQRLKKLNLNNCDILSVPEWLGRLHALEELDLSENNFSELRSGTLVQLQQLKKLNLNGCDIRSVPEWLGRLQALEELYLSGNNFSKGLHRPIGELQQLKKLHLYNCNLPSVPEWLGKLKELEELDLSENNCSKGLDRLIRQLKRLKKLGLSGCKMCYVPESLGSLEENDEKSWHVSGLLEELDLSFNKLSNILDCPFGQLQRQRLKKLKLSSCDLRLVPEWLGYQKQLEELDLSVNNFSEGLHLPIGKLQQLKKLSLSNCQLSSVPEWLGQLEQLEELDLCVNNFSDGLHHAIGKLHRLKKINLSNCKLPSVPLWVQHLEQLEELDLSFNKFSKDCSHLFGQLLRLKKLNLCSCNLLPVSLERQPPEKFLVQLEELNLSVNNFSEGLNRPIGKLQRLKKLTLYNCKLPSVPEWLGHLKQLKELDLSVNNFSEGLHLPIGELQQLKKLSLYNCQLSSVPEWLGQLEQLEELDLSENNCSEGLDCQIGKLGRLKKLKLRNCKLSSVLEWLEFLDELEELDLSVNNISEGTNCTIFTLERLKLKKLNLCCCNLLSVPEWLGYLKQLEELDLSVNNFSEGLGRPFDQLQRLKKLNLCNCNIPSVPEWVGHLEELRTLNLVNNRLQEYPTCLTDMNKLQELDLSNEISNSGGGNRIRRLPVELAFTNLRSLNVHGNPITEPPEGIWSQGLDAIRSFMRALLPGSELLRADTVNMLGDTGAGKTSVARSLIAGAPDPTAEADRTRVMERFRMKIDEVSGNSVNINDFGGHNVYHSVMQIFLPENGLLVLVIDLTREIQNIKKWLLTAIAKSREIRIVLVGTHTDLLGNVSERSTLEQQTEAFSADILSTAIDEVRSHISHIESTTIFNNLCNDSNMQNKLQKLRQLLSNLESAEEKKIPVVTLSCSVQDDGLHRLRDVIVPMLQRPQLFPNHWCRVMHELFKLSSSGFYVTISQVKDMAKGHFTDDDDEQALTTILSYLARTSLIIWAKDHPRLQNYIFHLPQKIINTCKEILHHDDSENNLSELYQSKWEEYKKGIVGEPLLRHLINKHATSLDRSQEPATQLPFDVAVDFLEQFNLLSNVGANKDGERRFVIPCKLTHEEPLLIEIFKPSAGKLQSRIIVRLSFIGSLVPLSFFETALSAMLTIAGRLSPLDNFPWRSGLIVFYCGVNFLAKLSERSITLTAFCDLPNASPWTVLQPMLQCLNEHTVMWHGAPPSCSVICPHCVRRCHFDDLRSKVGEFETDLPQLAGLQRQDDAWPRKCVVCSEWIERSLCFPPAIHGSAWVPAATQETNARSMPSRAWDHMDKKLLSEKFRRNHSDLVNKLSREEARDAAAILFSQDMLLPAEREQVLLDGKTATQAAEILIGYILKKDTKEMYCAFLEILHSQLKRDDLVKALTSLEP